MCKILKKLIILFAIAPLTSYGQASATTAVPTKIPSMEVEPGSKYYPAEVLATGAQGTAIVKAQVAADGSLLNSVVEHSSHSKQLDELAVAYVQTLKVKVKENLTTPSEIQLAVIFDRDTIFSITEKTCKEFNTDLAYARNLLPRISVGEMRAYKLATGLLMFSPNFTQVQQLAVARNLKKLPPKIEQKCAASPDAKFMETLSILASAK